MSVEMSHGQPPLFIDGWRMKLHFFYKKSNFKVK
jgi:hypothetical protein